MDIYIVTQGAYEDEEIVGVSTSLEDAKAHADSLLSVRFREAAVYGPYQDGVWATDLRWSRVAYTADYKD